MKFIDYLYYNTVQLITSMRVVKFRMERIPDQAAYSLSICIGTIFYTFDTIFEYTCLKTFKQQVPFFILVLIFFVIYLAIRYVYIIKGRYQLLLEKAPNIDKVTDKRNKTIIALFLLISYFLPFLVIHLLHVINPLNIPSNWK